MDDRARQPFCELLATHGPGVWEDRDGFRALLQQALPLHQNERGAILTALEHGVTRELTEPPSGLPWNAASIPIVARVSGKGLSEDAARWAVDSWALALGRVTQDEIRSNQPAQSLTLDANWFPEQNRSKTWKRYGLFALAIVAVA